MCYPCMPRQAKSWAPCAIAGVDRTTANDVSFTAALACCQFMTYKLEPMMHEEYVCLVSFS